MVGYGQITISSLVDASPTLGMKVNYSAFATANPGEAFLHGYTDEVAANVAGYVMWNGAKRVVPKAMVNPNAGVPYNKVIYIVLRLSSATAATGTLYNVWYDSGWKYGAISAPSAAEWTWVEATDIVLGQYVEPGSEAALVDAYLYWPPRRCTEVWNSDSAYEKAASAQSTANTANTSANNANSKIDNLQIGGRNLLVNTAGSNVRLVHSSGSSYANTSLGFDTYTMESGVVHLTAEAKTTEKYIRFLPPTDNETHGLEPGGAYTFSFLVKGAAPDLRIRSQWKTTGGWTGGTLKTAEGITDAKYTLISATDTIPADATAYYLSIQSYDNTNGTDVYIKNLMLEKGNRPSDWTIAPEDTEAVIELIRETAEKAKYQTEVVVGTQTAATAAWTGDTSLPVLVNNQSILYWLPFNSAANVTLNLTLADGTKTGAIPCYYGGTSRLGTQYAAGNAIRLLYREGVTVGTTTIAKGWWADANYNTNNYDRIQHTSTITAKTAITAGHMVVSGTDGQYFHLAANTAFDITKPILYAASAIAATKTGTNNYLVIPNINLTSTKSGFTGTSQNTVYIVGTLDGSLFTPNATLITTDQPQAEDGLYYIALGRMRSTTNLDLYPEHPIFRFYNGKFQSTEQMAYEAFVQAKNAQSDIDGLQIGGRNLLLNSSFSSDLDKWNIRGNVEITTMDGYSCGHITGGESVYKYVLQSILDQISMDKENEQIYTYSADVKLVDWSPGTTNPKLDLYVSGHYDDNGTTRWLGATVIDGSGNGNSLQNVNNLGWQHVYYVFKFANKPVDMNAHIFARDFTGDIYFRNLKLEKGSRATDWTPAPEDFDNQIAEETIKVYTNSVTTAQGFFNDAIKEYVRTTDIETFKQTVRTELNQTSDSIEMIFSNAVEQINALSEGTASEFAEIKKYIRFVNGSIILGEEDNPLVLTLVNNRIAFTSNGGEVAYFSDNQMHVDNVTVVNGADLCGLRITKDSNGDVYIS